MTPNVEISETGTATHGNEGGAEITQKDEHHQDHEAHGNGEGPFDVVQRGTNDRGSVHHHRQRHAAGNRGFQLREQCAHSVHRLDDVGARLPVNDDEHRRLAVRHSRRSQIFD